MKRKERARDARPTERQRTNDEPTNHIAERRCVPSALRLPTASPHIGTANAYENLHVAGRRGRCRGRGRRPGRKRSWPGTRLGRRYKDKRAQSFPFQVFGHRSTAAKSGRKARAKNRGRGEDAEEMRCTDCAKNIRLLPRLHQHRRTDERGDEDIQYTGTRTLLLSNIEKTEKHITGATARQRVEREEETAGRDVHGAPPDTNG